MSHRPTSILLLHGLGGSGEGSVRLLEEQLRARGWDGLPFLRPTLRSVHELAPERSHELRFQQALDELGSVLDGRVPHLTVGFSFGGLLAPFVPSFRRYSVCAPWPLLNAQALQRAAAHPGWAILQGAKDTVVSPAEALAPLPEGVDVTVDPEGTHDFDAWMGRIADWIVLQHQGGA